MRSMLRLGVLVLFLALVTSEGVAQWKRVTALPTGYASNHWLDVFFLPSNSQYGWICGFNGRVLRTTDGGKTWLGSQTPITNNLESIHFANSSVGYTSGNAGIFKSVDGGANWVNITPSGSGAQLWGCYFVDASTGVVIGGGCGTNQHFYRTTDGGANWSLYIDSVPNTGLSDAILYSANGLGYAASSGRIWQTNNGGQTWAIVDTSGPKFWNEELTRSASGNSFLLPVAGSSCGGDGGGGGMLFTTDNGSTWQEYATGVSMFGTYLSGETSGWACGDARSVYYTSDGGLNWQSRNCGIDPGDLDDIWFIDNNTGWVVGQGVYKYLWPPYDKKIDTLKYGEVCIPDTKVDTALIYNKGASMSQMNVSIGGPDASQFELVSPASVSVASCDSVRVIIRFRPTSTGAKVAVATMSFSSGSVSVELRGTGRLQSAKVADTLLVINPAQVGVATSGTIRWQNSGGMPETIVGTERLGGDASITLMPGFPPLPISAFGATIYVFSTPADTGWTSTRFRFLLSPCNNDTTVTVRVYGVSPIIGTGDTLKFNLSCRNEVVQAIPVSNTGNAPLVVKSSSISGANAADFSLLTTLPKTIAPGATDTLFVRFRPVAQGVRRAVLELVNNDSTTVRGRKNPRSIVLAGAFSKAAFTTSFQQINFGDVCVGDSAEMTVIVNGDLIVDGTATSWSVVRSAFRVAEPVAFPVTLPARQATQFLVRFRPSAAGALQDTLRIKVQPCDTTLTFVLKGRGIAPAVVVLSTDASVQAQTDTDAPLSVELNNATTESEQLLAVEVVDGNPAIRYTSSTAFPIPIPGGTMPLKFVGNAPDTGWFVARYRIVTRKGECTRDTIVSVRVYGLSPVVDAHNDLYFVLGTCNDAAIDTVFVRNAGNDTLVWGPLSAPFGANAGDFTILGTTRSGVLPPGDSVGIIVRFAPSAPGKRTASVSFEHNDRRSKAALPHPFVLDLAGERGFVLIDAAPAAAKFDTVCIGAQKSAIIKMRNTGTVKAFIVDLKASSQEYEVSIPGQKLPVELGSAQVGVEVVFAPKTPGFHRDTIIVSLQPCGEIHKFVVEGFAGETRLEADPATLTLGDIRTGVPTVQTVKITSKGNLPAHIEPGAITFAPARSDVSIKVISALPVVLKPGEELSVEIELFPKNDTAFSGDLCIVGTEVCPFSLCIPLSARSTLSQLAISEPGFGLVRCAGEVFDTVDVRNLGTDPTQISSVTIEPTGTPFSVVSAPSFVVQPGETERVIVRVLPPADGVYTATLVLNTDTEGRKEKALQVEYRKAAITLSAAEVNFGIYERCAGTLEVPVTLTSAGSLPDTVIIRRKHDVAGFSSVPADTVVVPPPPTGQAVITLRAALAQFATNGVQRDTFLLHSTGCGDYTIPVSIEIIDSRIAANPDDINFGAVEFGVDRDTTVEVTAAGAERRIKALLIDPPTSSFRVDPIAFPTVLKPGESIDLSVHFLADKQGTHSARLLVVHEGTCSDTAVVQLRANVPDNIFRLSFAFEQHEAEPGDTIDIPLRYSGPLARMPLTSLSVVAHFDKWLLQPLEIVVGASAKAPFNFTSGVLNTVLSPAVLAAAGESFGRDSSVFVIRALVLNSFPPSTPLFLDTVRLETAAAYSPVMLYNGLLTVDGSCGPVARLMRLGMVDVRGIAPHPANERIVLQLSASAQQRIDVEVYDAAGRSWYRNSNTTVAVGESSLVIDATEIPAGVYFVKLTSLTGVQIVPCTLVK